MLPLSRFQSNAADSPPLPKDEGEEFEEEDEDGGELRQKRSKICETKKINEKEAARRWRKRRWNSKS